MSFRNCLVSVLCSLALLLSASVSAQDKQLSDAKTFEDISAYLSQEIGKHNPHNHDAKENARVLAGILLPVSDKLLKIAQNDMEKRSAYNMKLTALQNQITAEIEGAEQRLDTLLNEIESHDNANIRAFAGQYRFSQFNQRVSRTEASPENYEKLKAELITWVAKDNFALPNIAALGLQIAERNGVPAKQFVEEFSTFVRSSECPLPDAKKTELVMVLEGLLRLAAGNDPKLYGRTLDDKEFEWEKLRGKYVLVQFTATWCGPCQMEIPGMLEAYEKYHDKGFEIVSVYVWQREDDPVATVKNYIGEKKIPWIIISEELSKRAEHPDYGPFYNVRGVPTMLLVDKEGKIIKTGMEARGIRLHTNLAEIFK